MSSGNAFSITDEHMPALFCSADTASQNGQWYYLALVRLDLFLLVIGGLATAWSGGSAQVKAILAVAAAIFLGLSAALTWIIRYQQFEKEWYGGRAVAESVKTLAWRYMMRAEPFDMPDNTAADIAFGTALGELLKERQHLGASLGNLDSTGDQITAQMRNLRNAALAERIRSYVEDRIHGQRKWYSGKAEGNRTARNRWFCAIILLQLAAMGVAIVTAQLGDTTWTLAPVVASAASACLAWMQVKQHQELAQAYGIAAHELGIVEIKSKAISADKELSDFVGDAEMAISREHTLWTARRDSK